MVTSFEFGIGLVVTFYAVTLTHFGRKLWREWPKDEDGKRTLRGML
jgi:hypothetical protein